MPVTSPTRFSIPKLKTIPLIEYSASLVIERISCNPAIRPNTMSCATLWGITKIMSAIIKMTAMSSPKYCGTTPSPIVTNVMISSSKASTM